MVGGEVIEAGEADAYGHRRLGGIGEALGEALKQRTGQGIVNQSLAYLMRSGPAVALDRMVASAFGTMAVQSLEAGETGLMMVLRGGREIPGQIIVLQQDPILQGLMPALDLALGLGVIGRTTDMFHVSIVEPSGQVTRDIA
jgi:hypothetical protein